jgi:hypothetical protein
MRPRGVAATLSSRLSRLRALSLPLMLTVAAHLVRAGTLRVDANGCPLDKTQAYVGTLVPEDPNAREVLEHEIMAALHKDVMKFINKGGALSGDYRTNRVVVVVEDRRILSLDCK